MNTVEGDTFSGRLNEIGPLITMLAEDKGTHVSVANESGSDEEVFIRIMYGGSACT